MIAITSLLIIVFISIIITRIATIALTHTGLARESAKFQARSAFSGVGFTTSESEMIVNHPVRRRIISLLMLFGNAGIVAAISSLLLAFVKQGDSTSIAVRIVILVGGIVLLWAFASSKWIDRWLSRVVEILLNKYTDLNVTDYASLLHLAGEYKLAELRVEKEDWLSGKTLAASHLREEGINALGIKKSDGTYIGDLTSETRVREGDCLVIYGRIDAIKSLDRRKKGMNGDLEHQEAIESQKTMIRDAKQEDTNK